jgi:hypothetical protein
LNEIIVYKVFTDSSQSLLAYRYFGTRYSTWTKAGRALELSGKMVNSLFLSWVFGNGNTNGPGSEISNILLDFFYLIQTKSPVHISNLSFYIYIYIFSSIMLLGGGSCGGAYGDDCGT